MTTALSEDLRDTLIDAATDTAGIADGTAAAPLVQMLALARLHADPRNRGGREIADDEQTRELADSIRENGVLQPLTVRPREDGDWDIVMGHRRRQACALAGLAAAPCIVRTMADQQALVENIIENLHREDLRPREEALGLAELVKLGMSQRQIAKRIGKTQAHVSRRLDLVDLPAQVVEAFEDVEQKLTIEDVRALKGLDEDVITKVLHPDAALRGLPIDRRINVVTLTVERAAARAKAIAELEAEGLTYVETPSPNQYVGEWPLRDRITLKAHEKLPCHAYALRSWDPGQRAAVCTNPKSHPPKERKETAAEKRTRLERERLQTEEAERKAEQQQLHTRIVTGKQDKSWDTFIEDLLALVVLDDFPDAVVEAFDLRQDEADDDHVLVENYIAKSAVNRRRALMAAGLAWVTGGGYMTPDEKAAYERLLTAHGWTAPS